MIITHANSVGESEDTTFQLHHVIANVEIIACCVDEAGTHIFCTCQARDFLGNLSSLAPTSSTCSWLAHALSMLFCKLWPEFMIKVLV